MSSDAAAAQAENRPIGRPVPPLNLGVDPNESLMLSAADDLSRFKFSQREDSSLASTKIKAAPELPLLSPSTQVTV